MLDNYLLGFLGLLPLSKTETAQKYIPWLKKKRNFSSLFSRQCDNSNNYIQGSDVLNCIIENKNKNLYNFNIDINPIEINTSLSPTNTNSIKSTINKNYLTINKNTESFKCSIFSIIYWLYSIFILSILCVPVILYAQKCINESNFYIPFLFFYLIYPIQYIFSLIYYSSDHYYKLIKIWDVKCNDKHCYLSKKSIVCIFIIVLSIIISIITYTVSVNNIYNSRYKLNNEIFHIIWIVELFYGRTLILFNLFVFFFIFHIHINNLNEIVEFLEKSNWVYYRDVKDISDICIDIVIKKYELEESIDKLQNIFSSSTILGTIGFITTILNFKQYGINTYLTILCSIYCIIQLYFFIIIYIIGEQQTKMYDSIRHPIFAAQWLHRVKQIKLDSIDDNKKQYLLSKENATSIDWIILNTFLKEEWVNFEFFGIPLNDGVLIKKCIGLIGMFISINKISVDYFLQTKDYD